MKSRCIEKGQVMDIRGFIKGHIRVIMLALLISSMVSLSFIKEYGIKDTAMIFLATVFLLLELYLVFIDKKKSLFMFIFSFPILVTARKICYFDLLFIRVSYETIYITLLFLRSLKDVGFYLKKTFKYHDSLECRFLVLVGVFFIFAINSSIFSQNIFKSISALYTSVTAPMMFFLCVVSIFGREDRKSIYYMLIAGIDLSCLYGFMQVFMNRIPLSQIGRHRSLITFGYHNVNIFAGILMLVLPFTMEMILYRKNTRREKVFLYSSFAINIAALYLTYTRGAWLTFLITAFIILISKKYRVLIYILSGAGLVMAKPVLNFIIRRGNSPTTSLLYNESAIARLQSLFTSIAIMLKYPFGTGAGNFQDMYKQFAEKGYLMMPENFRWNISVANYTLQNAHNLWLQIGVELGIVCMIVFLIIILNRIILLFRNYSENRAAFTSIMVYLMFSVLTGIEFDHKGVITTTLIIWLVFAIIRLESKERFDNQVNALN